MKSSTTLAVAVGASFALAAAAWWRHRQSTPEETARQWRQVGELGLVWCFPIKSCGAITLTDAECTILGLKHEEKKDRVFMVTGLDRNFKTARAFPHMTQIQPMVENNSLTLKAPGTEDICINLSSLASKEPAEGRVWDQAVKVVDCGDEVALWLSRFILKEDTGCRLCYYPLDVSTRIVRTKNTFSKLESKDSGAFPDASSYMIINEASVNDLNLRLPEGSHCTPLHFRPNFVVRGLDLKPYEEDNWRWIRIGDEAEFQCVKPCTRCVFTNINPENGKADPNQQPLKTLKMYRQITDPKLRPYTGDSPVLGVHLALSHAGHVRVGDPIFVSN